MGECSKETAFEILDLYYSQGGNFIDTANNYQECETEEWPGEWLSTRHNLDEIVLATKFLLKPSPHTRQTRYYPLQLRRQQQQRAETHRRELARQATHQLPRYIIRTLLRLRHLSRRTDDLAQLARGGRDRLVTRVSDMPAWFVIKCNAYARQFSLSPFVIYTGRWSAADREMEREILAMCESEQMAIAPWEVLGGGRFKSAEQIKNQKEGDSRMGLHPGRVEAFERVGKVLRRIGEEMGTLPTSVALAYVMRKQAYVFPLVGRRKFEHLKANIEALSLVLRDEDVRDIEKASEWSPGFPYDVLAFGAE